MQVLGTIGVILLLAFLVESLTEYLFGAACEHIPALKPFSWCLMYVAAAVGVGGAFNYGFDLIYTAQVFFENPDPTSTAFGVAITGLAIGRGANYIHDIFKRFFKKPE
jgi:hypothetical protein